MEIDDVITKVEIDDDGEGPSFKGPTAKVEVQDIEGEGLTLEKESIPVNSRMETRSMSRTSSPLLLRKFIVLSPRLMKCPP